MMACDVSPVAMFLHILVLSLWSGERSGTRDKEGNINQHSQVTGFMGRKIESQMSVETNYKYDIYASLEVRKTKPNLP